MQTKLLSGAADIAALRKCAALERALRFFGGSSMATLRLASGGVKIDLNKLRQARGDKAKLGREKVAALNALVEKGAATDEEKTALTALETEVDTLETEVAAMDANIAAEEKKLKRDKMFAPLATGRVQIIRPEPNPETTGGFHSLSELGRSVVVAATGGQRDPRLDQLLAAPSGQMQNQGAAGEGYEVPVEYRSNIWDIAFAPDSLLGMVTPEPTTSNAVAMGKDESTPWGATGVQAVWRSEASQLTASKLNTTGELLRLHEMYCFVIATQELLDDAPRLQDRLTNKAGLAIRWKVGDSIMWGTGQGQPLGFMKAGSLITVAKETGQATATLSVANLLKMSSRLLRGIGGSPIWIGNSDIIPQLGQLTIGNVPAWLPLNQPLSGDIEGMIAGRPFLPTDHNDTLGNLGDLAFINPQGYYAITKAGGGIDFSASIHLFFDYNMQALRWLFRFGGTPYLAAAVTPARGATTKSHFVTLAARP